MNNRAHQLSLFFVVSHLIIGLVGPLLPPSWGLIYTSIPGAAWIYPSTFVATAVIGLIGIQNSTALRLSFWLSAALFGLWGMAGLWLTVWGEPGGNWRGTFGNFQLAVAMYGLSAYVPKGVRSDVIDEKVAQLDDAIKENGNGPTHI